METPPEQRKGSWKKWLVIAVLPLLVLIGIVLIYDALGLAKLSQAIKATEAMGGPVTLEQVLAARKTYPEDKNGANVILGIKDRLIAIRKEKLFDDLPIFGSRNERITVGRRWSTAADQCTRKFLDSVQKELATIDTLKQYEGGYFPMTANPRLIDTLVPNFGPVRAVCQFKSLQVLHRAMNGDTTQLVDDVKVLVRTCSLVGDDPLFIPVLVHIACAALTLQIVEDVCALTPVKPDQLRELQDILGWLDKGERRIAWSMRGERAFLITTMDHIRATGGDITLDTDPFLRAAKCPGVRGFLMRDEAEVIVRFNQMIVAAEQSQSMKEALVFDQETANLGATSPISRVLCSGFSRFVALEIRQNAMARCAQVAMAVEQYRIETGSFPARLDQLVPKYIEKIPADPFKQDQPLKYAVKADRVIVYSVGVDGNDNGGNVDHEKAIDEEKGDDGFILLFPAARNLPPQPTTTTSAPAE